MREGEREKREGEGGMERGSKGGRERENPIKNRDDVIVKMRRERFL